MLLINKLSRYYEVFVAVSDYRFIPKNASIRAYSAEGDFVEIGLAKYECERANKKARLSLKKEGEEVKIKIKRVTSARE